MNPRIIKGGDIFWVWQLIGIFSEAGEDHLRTKFTNLIREIA
jgi:hypothetical protein